MKTVLVTINTPGSETGPNFNIFSNVDLVTPLVSSVSKTSLINGYSVTTVPDAATSIRVKSIPGSCSTYVDISIVTPTTTTTTTVGCTTVDYGYGEDPASACAAYFDFPETFQYDGTTLFVDNPGSPCGGGNAAPGYYSDGSDVYYWDGTTFSFTTTCGSFTLRTITIYAQRGAGSISSTNNDVDILYSVNGGNSWISAWVPYSHALYTSQVLSASFQVYSGTSVLIGMISRTATGNIVYSAQVGGLTSPDRNGLCLPFNYVAVNSNLTILLQAPVSGGNYTTAACP